MVMDAGYDAARLADLLRDPPVRVLARMRTAAGPITRRRPTLPMGTPQPHPNNSPRPGPPPISAPTRDKRLSRQRAKPTLPGPGRPSRQLARRYDVHTGRGLWKASAMPVSKLCTASRAPSSSFQRRAARPFVTFGHPEARRLLCRGRRGQLLGQPEREQVGGGLVVLGVELEFPLAHRIAVVVPDVYRRADGPVGNGHHDRQP
ncbi:hypothetical protein GCM10023170_066610 [Phytohabitans houttuyneae]|uniref:Transposase IS701-like DDE domain-containing protein n=1 Tax=Phytohabitans houttuyneae TaxID=1076126 RepID=A0A6V8K880_9ACTN|nr:hypothetical protein [Phytohabitans houttuyneae]GFJ81413.1 hypothetical protein Phou_055930 [Phytohabitans houttuyneae]